MNDKKVGIQGLTLNVVANDPVGFLEMEWLLDHCRLVLTDSGGLQKEAWFFQKSCATVRDETAWVELLETGGNRLAGANAETIIEAVNAVFASRPNFSVDLYGGGKAAGRIAERMLHLLPRTQADERG